MMPYIIILKVRKFHQTTASRFSTARKKPVGGAHCAPPPPSLNRVKSGVSYSSTVSLPINQEKSTPLFRQLKFLCEYSTG